MALAPGKLPSAITATLSVSLPPAENLFAPFHVRDFIVLMGMVKLKPQDLLL